MQFFEHGDHNGGHGARRAIHYFHGEPHRRRHIDAETLNPLRAHLRNDAPVRDPHEVRIKAALARNHLRIARIGEHDAFGYVFLRGHELGIHERHVIKRQRIVRRATAVNAEANTIFRQFRPIQYGLQYPLLMRMIEIKITRQRQSAIDASGEHARVFARTVIVQDRGLCAARRH